MSKAIVGAMPWNENVVADVLQTKPQPPISPKPIRLIDAPRQSIANKTPARVHQRRNYQSAATLDSHPDCRQPLTKIVA
jgi:hypothetical protein